MDTPTKTTQAQRVIAKFGGIPALVRALGAAGKARDAANVYRWTYPKTKKGGTGGLIPSSAMADVLEAARLDGVLLTPEDIDPRPR
jgi:hypothetical protein